MDYRLHFVSARGTQAACRVALFCECIPSEDTLLGLFVHGAASSYIHLAPVSTPARAHLAHCAHANADSTLSNLSPQLY